MQDVDSSIMELKKIVDLLQELKRYRMTGRYSEDVDTQYGPWRQINKPPQEKVIVYITVDRKEQGDRIIIEGTYENNAWFDEDGWSLEQSGITVIAWMPKFIPEPCKLNIFR